LRTDLRAAAGRLLPILEDIAARARWPVCCTIFLDLSTLCGAVIGPSATSQHVDIAAEAEKLAALDGRGSLCITGCYLLGSGNLYGMVDRGTTLPRRVTPRTPPPTVSERGVWRC
jgi:hypothetical protein